MIAGRGRRRRSPAALMKALRRNSENPGSPIGGQALAHAARGLRALRRGLVRRRLDVGLFRHGRSLPAAHQSMAVGEKSEGRRRRSVARWRGRGRLPARERPSLGAWSITRSRAVAIRSGRRRFCSQSRTVAGDRPNRRAKRSWDRLSRLRMAATSISSIGISRAGAKSTARNGFRSRALWISVSPNRPISLSFAGFANSRRSAVAGPPAHSVRPG